ncbi:hypothetical protein AX14_009587 [Amanita brunnescens Koide BX004]|nr:hypothetical protein AX14_009587 [Amanita brunnescens Koide BX004]
MDNLPEENEDRRAIMDLEEPDAQYGVQPSFDVGEKSAVALDVEQGGADIVMDIKEKREHLADAEWPDDDPFRPSKMEPADWEPDSEPDSKQDITNVGGIRRCDAQDVCEDVELVIEWTAPRDLRHDFELLTIWKALSSTALPTGGLNQSRVVYRSDGRIGIKFDPEDLQQLVTPRGWLGGDCINACGALFQAMLPEEKDYALFSTYNMAQVGAKVKDEVLWRSVYKTKFWKRPHWLLPIYREHQAHWVIAVVRTVDQVVLLFDSFGHGPTSWSDDIELIRMVLARLRTIAKQGGHAMDVGHGSWTVRPLTTGRLQTNQYDCGLWVLGTIAATLRGYDLPDLTEDDMPQVRQFLANILLSLPCQR